MEPSACLSVFKPAVTLLAKLRYIKKILLSFLLCALASYGEAMADSRVTGRVVDAAGSVAIPFADVIISDADGNMCGNCITDTSGRFEAVVRSDGRLAVSVSMMGYEPFTSDLISAKNDYDIGDICLKRAATSIDESVVTGERRQVVYKLDRQSISSSAVTASGGTAIDILATTSSVLVDSDGNLSLRGGGNYLVYVDGKLSPLEGSDALRQIPAGNIDNIEILTTPSARYKTDGDTAIINISTRKSAASGWSGIVNLTSGTLGTWGIDGTMNLRSGRNNWYFGGTAQNIKAKSDFTQHKQTQVEDVMTISESDGVRWKKNGVYTGKAGWQYSDGRHHNLAVELTGGQTSNWRGGDMQYDETRSSDDEIIQSQYDSHDRYNLRKNLCQASLEYVWRPDNRNEFSAGSRFRYDWYSIEYTESNMFDKSGVRYEGTRGYEEEHHWDCDGALAYRYSYSENGRLETGYQYNTYSEHGGYKIKYWNREAQQFIWQEDLATPFYYRRQVHSAYGMIDDRLGDFSFSAGVRADRVLDFTDIGIEGTSRDIKRFDIFPSAHVGYDAGRAGAFALGYSYRTNRPGIWNLEPYITYEDYYTKKIGNPDIRPEYAHSAELGWNKAYAGGRSIAATVFCKHRKDISDWIRIPYEPGSTLDYIVNAGDQTELGLEVNGVLKPVKWWQSTLNGSLFHYDFKSTDTACTDACGATFIANCLNTFTVKKKTRLQFDAHYVGPRILTQGREESYCHFEFGARRQLLNDRMSIALVGHDIFHTAKYQNRRESAGLLSTTAVMPKYPCILLSLSYNFNSSPHKSAESVETVLFEGKDF